MPDVRIKICGITNLDDALAAVDAGADMLGFNFYAASPRYISPQDCARIVNGLRRHASATVLVGVFVNAPLAEITSTLVHCGLDLAQLHGDEAPAVLADLDSRAFKAIRPQTPEAALEALDRYRNLSGAPGLLLDAPVPGQYGGTGRTGNWDLARQIAGRCPILLAGGLHPGNVAAAISAVQPWGVDCASGVEERPGKKDRSKMIAFVQAVRAGVLPANSPGRTADAAAPGDRMRP